MYHICASTCSHHYYDFLLRWSNQLAVNKIVSRFNNVWRGVVLCVCVCVLLSLAPMNLSYPPAWIWFIQIHSTVLVRFLSQLWIKNQNNNNPERNKYSTHILSTHFSFNYDERHQNWLIGLSNHFTHDVVQREARAYTIEYAKADPLVTPHRTQTLLRWLSCSFRCVLLATSRWWRFWCCCCCCLPTHIKSLIFLPTIHFIHIHSDFLELLCWTE